MPVVIEGFDFDRRNAEHRSAHGITDRQIDQLLDAEFLIVRNTRGRTAPYKLISRDHGGACIAVVIDATDDPGIWRPVTAWYCKSREWAQLS